MRRHLFSSLASAALLLAATAGTAAAQGHIKIFNANAPGVGFNDTTPAAPVGGNTGTTLGEQRMKVFEHAASIWETVLEPTTDIWVYARFVPLGPNVLGSAGPISVSRDFDGAEFPGTWYHEALANHLRGFDPDPHDPTYVPVGGFENVNGLPNPTDEINARFTTLFNFYFGLDNNEPAGTVDLLVVVLHEMGHGLGFSNLVNELDGSQFPAEDPLPDLYSWYTIDDTTGKIWNNMTNAERAASALNLLKVSWTGINVKKDVPSVLLPGVPALKVNTPPLGNLLIGAASFGQPFTAGGLTGDVVLGTDAVNVPGDACEPLTSAVAGKIALVDRGTCGFVVKVKNAQDAGAIAVIVADNVAGGPPPGLGGADPTIVIPSGRVTLADGNTLKANIASGLNVTLSLDTSILAGVDRVNGLALLATFDPVAPGSSISHFDGIAFKNQLMEPAINTDLTASVTPPDDLTSSLFTDIGWHSDRDGVPDGADQCVQSDTRPTVNIENCNTRVNNSFFANGCSLSDELIDCAEQNPNAVRYLICVARKTVGWTLLRIITPRNAVAIVNCAVRSLFN